MASKNNILTYQFEDENSTVEVYTEGDSLWMSKNQMANFFQESEDEVAEEINKLFKEKGLGGKNIKELEGASIYSFEVILMLGFEFKQVEMARFRRWAVKQLDEENQDDKNQIGWDYFDALEKTDTEMDTDVVFWYKALDLYAVSEDYESDPNKSDQFFKKMEKRLYWAVFTRTPEELIVERVDADEPHLGVQSFYGEEPNEDEAKIARNYLSKEEIQRLNRLRTSYLKMARSQAESGKSLKSEDWFSRLGGFLQMTGHSIIINQGHVTHDEMVEEVHEEYQEFIN